MPNFVLLKTRLNGEVFLVLNTGMPDYALNLDAPDPLAPLADYSEPHERDLALMVGFTHFLFTDATIEELCGTSAPWKSVGESSVRRWVARKPCKCRPKWRHGRKKWRTR